MWILEYSRQSAVYSGHFYTEYIFKEFAHFEEHVVYLEELPRTC